jgi:hypothetical protein
MSVITNVWQQLVRRRLWPVAVLLLGGLVATPVLLKQDPAPVPQPPVSLPATAKSDDNATATPVVAVADAADARRRHVLGARKDPFRPAPTPKAKTADTATTTAPAADSPAVPDGPSATGGTSTPGGGGGTSAPAPKKKTTYPADSLTVRFGSGDGNLDRFTLEKLEALPKETDATATDLTSLVVYTGLSKDGKEALFLVDASVDAQGDGHCESDGGGGCSVLHLRAGETEFLDLTDATTGTSTAGYELDLVAIHTKKSSHKAHSAKASAHSAVAHASVLPRAAMQGTMTGAAGLARLLAGF